MPLFSLPEESPSSPVEGSTQRYGVVGPRIPQLWLTTLTSWKSKTQLAYEEISRTIGLGKVQLVMLLHPYPNNPCIEYHLCLAGTVQEKEWTDCLSLYLALSKVVEEPVTKEHVQYIYNIYMIETTKGWDLQLLLAEDLRIIFLQWALDITKHCAHYGKPKKKHWKEATSKWNTMGTASIIMQHIYKHVFARTHI